MHNQKRPRRKKFSALAIMQKMMGIKPNWSESMDDGDGLLFSATPPDGEATPQKTTRRDYASALAEMQMLLNIQPDWPVIVEYADGLLFSASIDDTPTTLPQTLGALPDRAGRWERYFELTKQHPGCVVVIEYDGGQITGGGPLPGQKTPSRPMHGSRATHRHAAPR